MRTRIIVAALLVPPWPAPTCRGASSTPPGSTPPSTPRSERTPRRGRRRRPSCCWWHWRTGSAVLSAPCSSAGARSRASSSVRRGSCSSGSPRRSPSSSWEDTSSAVRPPTGRWPAPSASPPRPGCSSSSPPRPRGVGGETFLLPVLLLWRLAAGFVAVRVAFGLRPLPTAVILLAGVVAGGLAVGVILRALVSLAGWE